MSPDLAAYLYDRTHSSLGADVPLYTALATGAGGPVLELGCGTGRVLRGLVAAGLTVCGVDAAPARLRRARARLGASAPVTLLHGDMRAVALPGPFGVVILARSVLGYVHEDAAAVALLRRVRGCLAPGGLVVIDQVNPIRLDGGMSIPERRPRAGWDPALAGHISVDTVEHVDARAGLLTIRDRYVLQWRNRRAMVATDTAVLRVYSLAELLDAIHAAGLHVRGVYGDYAFGPYRPDAERLVVLAGRHRCPRFNPSASDDGAPLLGAACHRRTATAESPRAGGRGPAGDPESLSRSARCGHRTSAQSSCGLVQLPREMPDPPSLL